MKLFYDLMSQPSRAVLMYLKLSKIPFESFPVALRKGEQKTEEFKSKNRFQKVPFIHDNDFQLSESIAIVRYAALKNAIDNNWYPLKHLKKQAKVDEYLQWHHVNTRLPLTTYFATKWRDPLATGIQPKPEILAEKKENMIQALNKLETIWLDENKFLCGDEISIADVFAACEIEQPRIAGFEAREGRPVLAAWMERVKNATNPIYDETHAILYKVVKSQTKKSV